MHWIKRNWPYFTIVIIYSVGLTGFLIPSIQYQWATLTPLNLLVGLAYIVYFHQANTQKLLGSLLLVGSLGFISEVIGVQTGQLFGVYTYGNVLGPKILGTPLMLAVNWALMIYLTNFAARKLSLSILPIALIGSILMVAIDFLIEPFAIYFGLWTWELVHVPIQNYVMWFILSFVFQLLFTYFNPTVKNKIGWWLLIALVLFFLLVDVLVIWA